jgi:hypothetical protein
LSSKDTQSIFLPVGFFLSDNLRWWVSPISGGVYAALHPGRCGYSCLLINLISLIFATFVSKYSENEFKSKNHGIKEADAGSL